MSSPKKRPDPTTTQLSNPNVISTGSLSLDLALGTGGWPCGRIVEIIGQPGTGKTTLLLEAIAAAQRADGMGAFIDADHGVSQATAARLGLDLDRMPYLRTNRLEEAFEKIEELARGRAVSVIALDSIAALMHNGYDQCDTPPSRQNQDHLSRVEHYLKVLLEQLALSRTVLLVSNQLREKVGVMFGNPETTPWESFPLQDYASIRVKIERTGQIREGDTVVGTENRTKIIKNRLGASFTQADIQILFATGINREGELIGLGLEEKILAKRGACIFYDSLSLGNGWANAAHALREDPNLASRLRAAIVDRWRS